MHRSISIKMYNENVDFVTIMHQVKEDIPDLFYIHSARNVWVTEKKAKRHFEHIMLEKGVKIDVNKLEHAFKVFPNGHYLYDAENNLVIYTFERSRIIGPLSVWSEFPPQGVGDILAINSKRTRVIRLKEDSGIATMIMVMNFINRELIEPRYIVPTLLDFVTYFYCTTYGYGLPSEFVVRSAKNYIEPTSKPLPNEWFGALQRHMQEKLDKETKVITVEEKVIPLEKITSSEETTSAIVKVEEKDGFHLSKILEGDILIKDIPFNNRDPLIIDIPLDFKHSKLVINNPINVIVLL
jgi:hypothetical protein